MVFDFREFTPPSGAVYISPGTNIQSVINNYGPDTAFVLRAGVHRLQSVTPKEGMSFYGEVGADGTLKTTLNGANLITSFEQLSNGLYVIKDQTQAGIEVYPSHSSGFLNGLQDGWKGSNYPEDVFINNKPLKHVLSISDVVPGTFYFDYAADRVYIADNPTGKTVEVSAKKNAFFGSNIENVTIRNLRIEKYASTVLNGAIHTFEGKWIIEGNEVAFNHTTGISINSRDRTSPANNSIVRGNYIHTNGARGIVNWLSSNVLIEANEVAFNNFAKFGYHWDTAGVKIMGDNNVVRGNYIHDNDSRGIWTDVGSTNNVLENNLIRDNYLSGIDAELSFNGIIRNNTIGNNGSYPAHPSYDSQISLHNSRNTRVYDNRVQVASDYGTGIYINYASRDYPNAISVDNSVYNNQITYLGDAGDSGAYGYSSTRIEEVARKNRFYDNDYFIAPGSRTDRFAWGQPPWFERFNLQEFQSLGQDRGGSVSNTVRPLTWNWQYSNSTNDPTTNDPTTLRIEGEAFAQRTNFRIETLGDASGGKALSLKDMPASDGTATVTFNGVSGSYNIFLGTFDENDGAARFEVAKDGSNIGSITLNQSLGSSIANARTRVRRKVATAVQLTKDTSTIRIRGITNKNEFARLDYVEFVPITSSQNSLTSNTLASSQSIFDALTGSNSIDYLVGGVADNLFVGRMGNDVLTSGSTADRDIFLFNSIAERQDIIKDFDRVDSQAVAGDDRDIIQVSLTGFEPTDQASSLQEGVLPDNRLVQGDDSLGSQAGFRYFESSGSLYFDRNGGSFDNGTGSLVLVTLVNKPTFASLRDSIVVI